MHVIGEKIITTDDFVSIFGGGVVSLADMQTSQEGTVAQRFRALLEEARRSDLPLKRRFEFIASGTGNRIDATVCATVTSPEEVAESGRQAERSC